MTGRTNWKRIEQRRLLRRRGVEDAKAKTPVFEPPKQPRRMSKAELREQAEAALAAWRAGQTSKDK
jgi:hypothetical protein